ncbi:hypothetical protein TRFO_23883 [Tritrichomonas foetus]|uniref:Alcohol acetyltransferase n=1 Tax=Tritrichomonas foetus TaxID=1144522 RepID=A0A1J4KA00_9EUKA|nr:hypothetical protein TRFO_23883 [Tritrichomonas foetus]|eukprot:OHT07778.1 hypothetical protein TRFO_23883 [Tritrichomonas foetus]
MKLSTFEQMLSSTCVRAAVFLETIPSKEEIENRLQEFTKIYPILNSRIGDGNIYSDSKPVITETNIGDCSDLNETDFMTKVLSNIFSSCFVEFFIISRSNDKKGALLLSLCHSLCDGPIVGQMLADFVSNNNRKETVHHIPQDEVVKSLNKSEFSMQPKEYFNSSEFPQLVIPPPLPELLASKEKLYYRGICVDFDVKSILSVCHELKIRPQAFFSAADVYAICKSIKQTSPFSIVNQISVNTRRFVNVNPLMPTCYAAPVYVASSVDSQTTAKDFMIHIQKEVEREVPKYCIDHLIGYTKGQFPPAESQSLISNVGIIESDYPIWIQGGMTDIPEAARAKRGFTSHLATSKSKNGAFDAGCAVLTFLTPSCDQEFVDEMVNRISWFLKNPTEALKVKFIE